MPWPSACPSAALRSNQLGLKDQTTWATVAAVLAVVAAVTSAWTSQRVVELQEDALEPVVVPSIDYVLYVHRPISAMDADVETIGSHLSRVWVICSACGAYFERRFTPQTAR